MDYGGRLTFSERLARGDVRKFDHLLKVLRKIAIRKMQKMAPQAFHGCPFRHNHTIVWVFSCPSAFSPIPKPNLSIRVPLAIADEFAAIIIQPGHYIPVGVASLADCTNLLTQGFVEP